MCPSTQTSHSIKTAQPGQREQIRESDQRQNPPAASDPKSHRDRRRLSWPADRPRHQQREDLPPCSFSEEETPRRWMLGATPLYAPPASPTVAAARLERLLDSGLTAGRRRARAGGAVHGLARAGAGSRHGRARRACRVLRRGGRIQRHGRARRGGRHGRAHEDDAEKHARWSWMRAVALPPVLDGRRHHRGGRGCRETRRAGLWPPHSGAEGRGCRVTQRLKTCAAAPLCSPAHAMRRRACPPASCRGRASSRNRSAKRADNVL